MKRDELPAHAKYAPSAMARILGCPGSVAEAEQAPPRRGNTSYSDEGTAAHALAEALLLQEDTLPRHDTEMLDAVMHYVDFCDKHLDDADHYGIEARAVWTEDIFGTIDCWFIKDGTLFVVDYKHGAGVKVDPEENAQLLTYALLLFLDEETGEYMDNVEKVTLVVVQPRCGDTPITDWDTTPERLVAHQEAIEAAIERDHLELGDWCRWCPAKLTPCPKIRELEEGVLSTDPNDLEPEELARQLDACAILKTKIADLEAYGYERASAGVAVPGWKLVQKRGRRQWSDPDAVHRWGRRLGKLSKLYGKSMLSPTQVFKAMPEHVDSLSRFVENTSSGLTLVPESDKRPSAEPPGVALAALGQRLKL